MEGAAAETSTMEALPESQKKRMPAWLLGASGILLAAAPLLLSDFRLSLLGKFLTYAIVALGVDLIWGYAGMLSLGHGVFFGLGAYVMGMFMKLESAGAELPDFMAWSGLEDLPWFWRPFRHAWLALPMTLIIPMLAAGIAGYLIFRSRTRGPYFAIITQALALVFATLLVGQQPYTGGTNGITNFSTLFGLPLSDGSTQHLLYYAALVALGCAYLLCHRLADSRFGRLLVAIRDGENRVRFSGYDPVQLKTIAFALSGGLAGLAGALFVPQVGIISPAMVGVVPSIEMVIWVAVGGRGKLAGAVFGAILVNAAKSAFSELLPAAWLYSFGALFIASVVFFPGGILGLLQGAINKMGARLKRSPGGVVAP